MCVWGGTPNKERAPGPVGKLPLFCMHMLQKVRESNNIHQHTQNFPVDWQYPSGALDPDKAMPSMPCLGVPQGPLAGFSLEVCCSLLAPPTRVILKFLYRIRPICADTGLSAVHSHSRPPRMRPPHTTGVRGKQYGTAASSLACCWVCPAAAGKRTLTSREGPLPER